MARNYFEMSERLGQKALNHLYKDKNYNNLKDVDVNSYIKSLSCYFGAFRMIRKYENTHVKIRKDIEYKHTKELKRQIDYLFLCKDFGHGKEKALFILNLMNNPMPQRIDKIKNNLDSILYTKTI
jgi:hypothetical protein